MSKAFTSEDAATPDVVVPQRIKLPPPETPPLQQLREQGKVRLGARVTLEDDGGRAVEYALVPSDEADPASGRVSVESPLGRALLGKSEGDEVVVERPRGRAEYTVTAVRF
jgi:transcription elongation GreA/GreB family factor